MNELQVFNNEEFKLQVMTINNEPWFVGNEVAKLLGYSNPQKAVRDHVDEEDKGGSKMRHPWRKAEFNNHQRKRTIQPNSWF